jgi:hypothetical protein
MAKDLTGQKFGMLKVLKPVPSLNRWRYWLCHCQCGKDIIIREGDLIYRRGQQSCGCITKQTIKIANSKLIHFNGTCIQSLKSTKMSKANKSGYRGVIRDERAKSWKAQITFKGKVYYLGYDKDVKRAAELYTEAKERIHFGFVEWYERNYKNGAEVSDADTNRI